LLLHLLVCPAEQPVHSCANTQLLLLLLPKE
jgi:hypothetical protein